jgi:SAM-dependent MidA family methyltransferase
MPAPLAPGAERFDAYVQRCLYDPQEGFYVSGEGSAGGHRGDFITSPETGPLFAEVLARAIDWWWVELGRPPELTVYDAGTGPGTLARSLARTGGPSAAARRVHGFDRTGGGQIPAGVGSAVVIANELLDNLPFRVVERVRGGWQELHVATSPSGALTEELVPIDDPGLDPAIGVGSRAPLLDQASQWVAGVLEAGPAVLIAFDYGTLTTAELAERGGWLRTYRRHQRGHDPLIEPGRWDITTDIAVDQLPAPTEVVDQATFLRRWGIDELVEEGKASWAAHAAAPDLAAMKMRSRVSEAEALLDPAGLGSWLACTWIGR